MMTSMPPEANMASSILGIISDPAAAKQRLEELTALQKQAEVSMDASREAHKAAEAKLAEASEAHAQLDARKAQLDSHEDALEANGQKLMDRINQTQELASQVVSDKRMNEAFKLRLDNTSVELDARRASLSELEASLVARSQSMAEQEAVLKAKMEQLKALVS